jgi:LacI family transcriptional regulator
VAGAESQDAGGKTVGRSVTMADVAMNAGVSVSTVSHVVNGTRPVSAVLRARVLEVIRQSHYSPNTVARSLATSDTHLIGIVMSALTNHFFVPVVAAIDRAGRRRGYSSVLADSRDKVDDEAEAVSMLISRRVDGIVLAPTAGDKEAVLDKLAAEDVPTVLVDRFADSRFDQVGAENREATASLVQHLAALGHSRIAFVSGMKGVSTTRERVEGYRLGLQRTGLRFDPVLVCSGRSAADPAERAINSILARRNPPTAIVSSNNYMTIGVLRALQSNGMRVPEDISLVAYDDLEFGEVFQPRLTVMAQPISEIASTAVSLLIGRINNKDKTRVPQRIQMAATFIHRESCGCGLRD